MKKEFLGEDNDEVEICKDNKKQIRLTRWNKENFLDVEYKGKEECEFIKKGQDNFEILTTIKEKPKTNKFIYYLEGWEEFNFHYQPELTEKEKKEGCSRPENVVGSYAVYHKTKRNHAVGKINYKCGKAFHIYRPKIIDDNGDWIWGEMNITDNKLIITINQEWLDNAVYPVTIDPDFGYDTIGGSWIEIAEQEYTRSRRVGSAWPMPAPGGTANWIKAYVQGDGDATDCKVFINQKDSVAAGQHGQIAIDENLACPIVAHWEQFDLADEVLTATIDYILNIIADWGTAGVNKIYQVAYDTDGAVASYSELFHSYDFPESPWVVNPEGTTKDYSIYCNYTEVAVETNMKMNIGDVFKDIDSIQINIGDVWKDVTKIQINIGDAWKDVFG